MKNFDIMMNALDEAFENARGWDKAVLGYACDMLEALENEGMDVTEENLLDGASDWKEYSLGAHNCAFAYDNQIEEYFTMKKCVLVGIPRTWHDWQAQACEEASRRVLAIDLAVNGY